ncbi:MAG: oligosaccharide flippase family protein [Clostridia bacterium]|nr:oligosaccharide flippase family protein [Clostridia bacterium]
MNRKVGVIFSYVLMFVEICSTMLFTPFLIRTLGQAEYGIYHLILSILSYFTLLDLGVGNSVIRYMSKYSAENNKKAQCSFMGVTTIYYSIIAVIAFVIGLVVKQNLPQIFETGLTASEIQLAEKLFSIAICNTVVSLATSAFSNAILAHEHFMVSKGTTIVMTIIKVLLSVVALKMGMSSKGVLTVHLITTCITRGIYVVYVVFKLKIVPSFKNIQFSFLKEVASYSSFILLQLIASYINSMSDQILLGMFAQGSAVIIGIYSIGAQILQYFKTVGAHFTGVLMPGLVRLVDSKPTRETYEKEMIKIGRIVFMVLALVWCVFLVFGKDFICLWAGEENSQAYIVAIVLMFPTLFGYAQGTGYQLLQAMAKHKLPAIIQVGSAILHIILVIILIKWNALYGTVIGSFVSLFLCDMVIMTLMYKKQIGIRLKVFFGGMFKGTVPCLLLSTVVGFLLKTFKLNRFGWLGFVVNCGVMVAIYGVTMLLYGMNDYEKNLVFKPFKKILKKIHVVKEV